MKIRSIHTYCILLLFLGTAAFHSCTKTTPEEPHILPEPKPEPVKNQTYVYNSESQVEFSFYRKDVLKSSFEANDQEKKFKNRTKYFKPLTMTFKGDSLFIIKPGSYKESYKIKWEKENLFLYQDQDKSWKHFANKDDRNHISLNIVLYNSQLKSSNSNALRTGQLYNPLSINEILSEKSSADMETTWLKIKIIYIPENK